MLIRQPTLLPHLSDPLRFEKEESVRLFKNLLVINSSLDLSLARCLPDRTGISEVNLSIPESLRALSIIDETSIGRRVIPILGHLVNHPDKRISSTAALVVGKRIQSVDWAKRFLRPDHDDRLRANAIVFIWVVAMRTVGMRRN